MAGSVTFSTVRLAVRGAAGTVDLVVPRGGSVADVAREYAAVAGLSQPPALVSLTGRPLGADDRVHDVGLDHGDVVVALDGTVAYVAETSDALTAPPTADRLDRLGPVLLAVTAGLVAAVVAAYVDSGTWRLATAGVLLAAAVLALLPRGGTAVSAVAAPGLAAAGGFVGAYTASAGGLLLAVAVAGLAAAAAAALGRSDDPERDDLMRVWLFAAVIATVVAAVLLLLGAGDNALWAVLLAGAVLVAKLLPGMVVDVPDHMLLDLDRLAVTAWSAREKPRGNRRRRMTVNADSVADVVHRGHLLISAVTLAVAVTATVAAPLLLLAADVGTVAIGVRLEVVLAGAALAFMSRSYRAALPRTALRFSGAWCLGLTGLALALALDGQAVLVMAGVVAALALVVLVAAVALGNGWRSVWWARAAEILEELCIALCIGVVPVAAGLFAFMQQLPS